MTYTNYIYGDIYLVYDIHKLCLVIFSDISYAPQIVCRRFGLRLIVADCSQVLGKPNGDWAGS